MNEYLLSTASLNKP